jgi:hypothetical protein
VSAAGLPLAGAREAADAGVMKAAAATMAAPKVSLVSIWPTHSVLVQAFPQLAY